MAIKIKKKVNRPVADDPNQPDQILVATRDTFDWLNDHWKPVLAGIAGLVVVIVAGSLTLEGLRDRNVATSSTFFEALALASAAPGSEGVPDDAQDQIRSQVEAFLTKAPPSATLARLVRAGALIALGEAAGAIDDLEAFRASARGPAEATVAVFGLAAARAETGDVAGAMALLDGVAAEKPALAASVAVLRAHVLDAQGTPEQALEAWERVRDEHPTAPGADFAEQRTLGLQLALGRTVTGEPD